MAGKKKKQEMEKKEKPKKKQKAGSKAEEKTAETEKKITAENDPEMKKKIKEIENALFKIKFFPVAVKSRDKREAVENMKILYKEGDENIRQLILYMIHETLAESSKIKIMKSYEYFNAKHPESESPKLRMQVYRSIFNYHTSLEGLMEVIQLLGRLGPGDNPAKVLTHHYTFLTAMENEAGHSLKNAIIDALGESDAPYAMISLVDYSRYTDNDKLFRRIVASLQRWDEKMDMLDLDREKKKELRVMLREVITKGMGGRHYG